MVTRAVWLQQLQKRPDRPQGRQRRQLDVLTALADQLDADTGEGQASVLDVAKAAGVSERTAKRALGWAKAAGVLQQTTRGHRLGDGTAVPSGWWLIGESPSQGASPAAQRANSRPQGASSPPQRANSANAANARPKARRTGKRSTSGPAPAREVLAHRDYCRDCGFELDPALAATGATVHPGCTDPLTSTTRR